MPVVQVAQAGFSIGSSIARRLGIGGGRPVTTWGRELVAFASSRGAADPERFAREAEKSITGCPDWRAGVEHEKCMAQRWVSLSQRFGGFSVPEWEILSRRTQGPDDARNGSYNGTFRWIDFSRSQLRSVPQSHAPANERLEQANGLTPPPGRGIEAFAEYGVKVPVDPTLAIIGIAGVLVILVIVARR